jgi:hypothetical protein
MTALAAQRSTIQMLGGSYPEILSVPVADNVVIYKGSLVGLDSAGRARPMAAAATTARAIGRAEETVDNTGAGHSAGKYQVRVAQGIFKWANDTSTAVTNALRGTACYGLDDNTVTGASASNAVAGTVIDVVADGVWVQTCLDYRGIDDAALRAALASTANADGASLVAIEDALSLLAAGTVEAAIAELAKYQRITLADPGHAQAIPVTRSASVEITIGSSGAETNTLAIPTFVGQTLQLNAAVVGTGTRVVTAAQAINQTGNTIMTFAAARDFILLVAVKVGTALRWTVAANDGVALSGP